MSAVLVPAPPPRRLSLHHTHVPTGRPMAVCLLFWYLQPSQPYLQFLLDRVLPLRGRTLYHMGSQFLEQSEFNMYLNVKVFFVLFCFSNHSLLTLFPIT